MKTIYYFAISLFLYFTISLSGCGNNPISPTTTGNPPTSQDSLLFEKDSLSLYGPSYNNWQWYIYDTLGRKFKTTFTATTNTDSSKIYFGFVFNHPPYSQDTVLENSFIINNNHIFISKDTMITYLGYGLTLPLNDSFSIGKYVKLTNIKIYKVN